MSKEEAEKEWDLQSQDCYFKSKISSPGSYKQGISDYKSALREEIEKEMDFLENSEGLVDRGAREGYKTVLNLLDTITPKK